MVFGVGRVVVTQREDHKGSASVKRLEIWRQLVPLRALLDSPTRMTKRLRPWRVAPTRQCGPGPTRLPKAARNWRRTAAGSASVCGASVRTREPAIPWRAVPSNAGGGGADDLGGSTAGGSGSSTAYGPWDS